MPPFEQKFSGHFFGTVFVGDDAFDDDERIDDVDVDLDDAVVVVTFGTEILDDDDDDDIKVVVVVDVVVIVEVCDDEDAGEDVEKCVFCVVVVFGEVVFVVFPVTIFCMG